MKYEEFYDLGEKWAEIVPKRTLVIQVLEETDPPDFDLFQVHFYYALWRANKRRFIAAFQQPLETYDMEEDEAWFYFKNGAEAGIEAWLEKTMVKEMFEFFKRK